MLHTLALGIGVCQVKHVEPHAVDTCQGDELELVAHIRQLLLEAGNSFVVEVFLPVERRRAVISQQFARIFRVEACAKRRASSRSGVEVSHHTRSAYGAYARPRLIACSIPA